MWPLGRDRWTALGPLRPLRSTSPPRRAGGPTLFADPAADRALARRRRHLELPRRGTLAAVAALTLLALALRLAIPRGIWLDEAITLHQVQLGLGALVDDLQLADRHPPLHHIVLWVVAHTAGTSDLLMRLPTIVAGALLVPAVYGLGSMLHDRRCGLAAAALATVAPLMVWYAQEARMYAFVALFAALSTLALVRALRSGAPGDWTLYAFAASAMVWSHYGGLAILAAQGLCALVDLVARRRELGRGHRLGALAAFGVLAWQLVPLGAFARRQYDATGAEEVIRGATAFNAGQDAGLSFYDVLSNASWALWGYHPDGVTDLLTATWPLLLLAALALLGRGLGRQTAIVLAVALLPALAFLAAGTVSRDLFEVRYLVGSVPLVLVLLARLTTSWPTTDRARLVVTGLLALTFAVGLADQQLDRGNPRLYAFDEALEPIERAAAPGDVMVVAPRDLRYVAERYAPSLRRQSAALDVPTRREAARVFLVASFQEDPRYKAQADRAVRQLRAQRRALVARRSTPQVTTWEFR